MSELTIEVSKREATGTNANRRLRQQGALPGVLYGAGKESVPIQLDRVTMHRLIKEGGENAVFLLKLTGTKDTRHAMVRDMDVDPISRLIRHVDFQRILLTEKVKVQVQIQLIGEPLGVKNDGGVLDFITREVAIEALPNNIPQSLVADVSELEMGQHLEIGDIPVPDGVEFLDDPGRPVAAVAQSRVAASLEIEDEEGEDLLEAETLEPEVIGQTQEGDEAEGGDS